MSDNNKDYKIALFIDAENVSYKNSKKIIEALEEKGKILVREIIADWTIIHCTTKDIDLGDKTDIYENLCGWREVAASYSMTAIQQFTYVPGKNPSDIALTISAMKTLYEKQFIDLFCIVSNDSDYTRLAQELREHDKEVIGMGDKKKINQELINAFSEFVYLFEPVASSSAETDTGNIENEPTEQIDVAQDMNEQLVIENERLEALISIIGDLIDNFGKALYSMIGGDIRKKYPDFIPSNYGCKTFRQLMDKLLPYMPMYRLEETNDDKYLVNA